MSLPNEAAEINEAMHLAVTDYCRELQESLHKQIDYPLQRDAQWNLFDKYLEDYLDNLSQS